MRERGHNQATPSARLMAVPPPPPPPGPGPQQTKKAHPAATAIAFGDGTQWAVSNGVIGAQTR
jgi:hypothetical protein